jgi:hypothetical protein
MKKKLKIDMGLMFSAIEDQYDSGGIRDTAYLNRRTGDIVFLPETDEEGALEWGISTEEIAEQRAEVESQPDDWVEIPKQIRLPVWHQHWCDVRCERDLPRDARPCTCGAAEEAEEEDDEEFINEFLREHGIEAELI